MASPGEEGESNPQQPMRDTFLQDNPMWFEIMKAMKCNIEEHVMRVLDLSGYNSYPALKDFKESDFVDCEELVKTGLSDLVPKIENQKLYLGKCTDHKKFKFAPGEKSLMRRVVKYVERNHTEEDRPLGKCTTSYPIFAKKNRSQQPIAESEAKKSRTVVSDNIPQEIAKIRKLINDYFGKKQFPKEYCEIVPGLSLTVKTVEKGDKASLSVSFECPFCGGKGLAGGYREDSAAWTLSNINRHFTAHVKKNDKVIGTVNPNFFQSVFTTSSEASLSASSSKDLEEENSELVDGDLTMTSDKIVEENPTVNIGGNKPTIHSEDNLAESSSETSLKTPFAPSSGIENQVF